MAKNDTIEQISEKCVKYAESHYKSNSFIIFDGYPNVSNIPNLTIPISMGTKESERSRRKKSTKYSYISISND